MKKLQKLTKEWVREETERRRVISLTRHTLGRKFILRKWWAGIPEGTVGWIIDTWPNTQIAFENWGSAIMMSQELDGVIEATDERRDVDEILESLGEAKRKPISRKL